MTALAQPEIFLDLRNEFGAELAARAVHRELRGPVTKPDREVTATALVRMEHAPPLLQPPPKFG